MAALARVWRVEDRGIDGLSAFESIKPGKSVTFKDGFTVPKADNTVYELAFDGLAGRSLYWSTDWD